MPESKLHLVTLTQPRSPAAEAYRALRTNLTFAALDTPLSTLVVTSPAGAGDKSEALGNLAVAMAQGERRTILVDADLRRPLLHEIFGVSNAHGLTDMILESAALDEPPLVEVGVPNLWLLPSGPLPPNPSDLLGSQRMERVIDSLKRRADVVLFDAPPVMAVTDAAVLGARVDGVLLVLSAGRSRRDHAQQAQERLAKVRARVVGAVLTHAPVELRMAGY